MGHDNGGGGQLERFFPDPGYNTQESPAHVFYIGGALLENLAGALAITLGDQQERLLNGRLQGQQVNFDTTAQFLLDVPILQQQPMGAEDIGLLLPQCVVHLFSQVFKFDQGSSQAHFQTIPFPVRVSKRRYIDHGRPQQIAWFVKHVRGA